MAPRFASWDPRRLPRVRMFRHEPRLVLLWALALGTLFVLFG